MMEHACAASSIYCSKRCGWCQGYSYVPRLRLASVPRCYVARPKLAPAPTRLPDSLQHRCSAQQRKPAVLRSPTHTNIPRMFWLHLSPVDQALLPARSGRLPRLLHGQFVRRTLRLFQSENLVCGCDAVERSLLGSAAFRCSVRHCCSVAADELDRPALSLNKSKLTSLLELSLRTVRCYHSMQCCLVWYGACCTPACRIVHAMVPDDPARALGACPALCRIDISLNWTCSRSVARCLLDHVAILCCHTPYLCGHCHPTRCDLISQHRAFCVRVLLALGTAVSA